jgi:hypothetical protein
MKKHFKYLVVLPIALLLVAGCDSGNGQKNPAPVGGIERNYNTRDNKETTPPKPKGFVPEPGQGTAIQFAHLTMLFGPVMTGDTVNAVYPFKNMSQSTVRIAQAATSCDCLKTEFPQGNIQPGQEGEIIAHFYTKGQWGTHEKIIAVQLEGEQDAITLRLNGQVLKADQ